MANPPRTRKRVRAIRRASDGSAFQNCENCGVSVAIALADLHECEFGTRKNVKRFKGLCKNQTVTTTTSTIKQSFQDQPRSPFRFFMDGFLKACEARDQFEADRKGYEKWKNMTKQERLPYVLQAKKVNSVYTKALLQQVEDMPWVDDDEADSAEVGQYDENYEVNEYYEDSEKLEVSESYWVCEQLEL